MEQINILVVDDRMDENLEVGAFYELEKARQQFAGKNVELRCIIGPLAAALVLTSKAKFDIVLTSLMMKGENEGMYDYVRGDRPDVPYGLAVAMIAKNEGVEHVAILTDIDLHLEPIAWSLHYNIGQNNCISVFNDLDWLAAAKKFMEIKDVPPGEKLTRSRKRMMLAGINDDFKESLKVDLPSDWDVIFVKESESNKAFDIFLYGEPEFSILVGDISDEREEHSIGHIFRDMNNGRRSEQKFLALGWEENEHCNYLKLPCSNADILAKLQEGDD